MAHPAEEKHSTDKELPRSPVDSPSLTPPYYPLPRKLDFEDFELSDGFEQLFEALSQAQAKIDSAEKSGTNVYLGNRYSTLDDVRRACAKPLSDAKIGWTQVPINTGERLGVITLFVHQGQWMRSKLSVEVPEVLMSTTRKGQQIKTYPRTDPQQLARIITYLRRISLSSMAGVTSTEEDTDGGPQPPAAEPSETITEEQLQKLNVLMGEAGVKVEQIKTAYNIANLTELPQHLFESCKSRLESTIESKAAQKPSPEDA